jgi:chromosome segregation ATPase
MLAPGAGRYGDPLPTSATPAALAEATAAIEAQKLLNAGLEAELQQDGEAVDAQTAELQVLQDELKQLKRGETQLRLDIKAKKNALVEVLADIRKAKSDRTKLTTKSATLGALRDKADAGLAAQIEKRSQLRSDAIGDAPPTTHGMTFGDYFGNQ